MRRWTTALAVLTLALGSCTSDPESTSTSVTTSSSIAVSSTTVPSTTTSSTTISTTTTVAVASTTTTLPPPPNEVVVALDQLPDTLIPYGPGSDDTWSRAVAQALHAGLTELDGETLRLRPVLATEIPSVTNGGVVVNDDDSIEVTFTIRDDAVWSDGTPITGEDVAFTLDVIRASATPFVLEPYDSIVDVVADGKRATLTLAKPTLAFETMFPALVPAHQVRGSDVVNDWNETPWLSAGPFVFDSRSAEELVLTRNDRYWGVGSAGQQLPYLDRVVFRALPDPERLIDAVVNGDVDVTSVPPSREFVSRVTDVAGLEVTVRGSPIWEHLSFQFGWMNRNDGSLNADLDFRKAVAHAIDRQPLLDLGFWPGTEPVEGLLDLHGLPSDDPWAAYPYDPVRARELIGEVCTRVGRDCAQEPPVVIISTTSNAEERPVIAELLADMFDDVGLRAGLQLEDSSLFFGPTLQGGTWDLGIWAWVARPDPAGVITTFGLFDPGSPIEGDPNDLPLSGTNYQRWGTGPVSGWPTATVPTPGNVVESVTVDVNQAASPIRDESTARFEVVFDALRSTADRSVFETLAAEAESILAEQLVVIPLVTRGSVGVVRADRIAGYVYSPWIDTWNIELWSRVG